MSWISLASLVLGIGLAYLGIRIWGHVRRRDVIHASKPNETQSRRKESMSEQHKRMMSDL